MKVLEQVVNTAAHYPPFTGEQGIVDVSYPVGHVKRYGARGDGQRDDTAAFQVAASAAGVVVGSLVVPPSSSAYKVTGQITVPAGVTLDLGTATLLVSHASPIVLGDGANVLGGTIQWTVSTALNAVMPGNRSHIIGTRFVGSGATGTAGAPLYQRGIYGTIASDVLVLGCSFENMTVGCWSGPSSVDPTPNGWRVIGNTFENIVGYRGQSEGYGCLFTPSSDGVIAHNVFRNIARHAVYLAGGACRSAVVGNTVDVVDNIGIQLNCNLAQPVSEGNVIAENTISNVTRSIAYGYRSSVGIGVYGNNSGTLVTGNRISKYLDTGIDFASPSQDNPGSIVGTGYTACGNYIDGSTQGDACMRTDNPDDCDLHSNVMIVANNSYGIVTGGSFASISGRKSRYRRNEIVTLGAGSVGIRIASSGSATDYTDNDIDGSGANYYTASAALFTISDTKGYIGVGDNDFAFSVGVYPQNVQQTTTLTANRAITLSRTGAKAGSRVRVARPSTGAFTLTVQDGGAGTLKVLASGQWVDVVYDGGQWTVTGFGSL